ncbi:YlmH/Sll1252 family protein [Pseudoramibacter sp.]|uniref:YlmH/Sll1252 family protein n=1 Tax=Pseudoramibacter sp. TaxID=2034862 RepID=UPI0025F771BE|nr:YlmH/Sll1252 family protein [Pseudoramibacter sp.]MCH4072711.1 YlmH/Sll1252 family protein [Pseudoramibacter sp.]MCH4106482.1 YlmH/Sll1252 family protein [Pseudoramibacter sp.]
MKEKKQEVILSRLEDALFRDDRLYFFGFYDEIMQSKIRTFLDKKQAVYTANGGFPEASRKMFCLIPKDWESFIDAKADLEWPMMAVRFDRSFSFNHRHVLGTLMGLGIEHQCIGDISFDEQECQVVFDQKIFPFLKNEFVSIRGRQIKPSYFEYPDIRPFQQKKKQMNITVNSPRIDTVIDRIWGLSRQNAETAIRQSRIRVNYAEIDKKNYTIKSGDIISFKGKGKAKIVAFMGKSKKGKYQIQVEKYI